MVSSRISAERKRVARGTESADHSLAVAGAAGLHHQERLGLVHVQPRAQPLLAYLEHVGAEIGQVAEQLGQRSPDDRAAGSGTPDSGRPRSGRAGAAWTAAAGRCCARRHGHHRGTEPRECSSRAATPRRSGCLHHLLGLISRMAAAERLLRSLSEEQRQQLAELMSTALDDAGLESEMARLADALRASGPIWTGRA